MIRVIHTEDYQQLSRRAAGILAAQVVLKPACVLGLATGSSPVGAYRQLIEWHQTEGLDFSLATSINLDEYAGLGAQHPQSYRYFMQENLFSHINIAPQNTHVPNGLAENAEEECARYDAVVAQSGGIDLQLLGLGENGHIGFNEPAGAFATGTHKVALAESTIRANTRFFEKEADVPRFAYTMGVRSILSARRILVVASGRQKAKAVRDALRGPVTPQLPASALQLHGDVTLVADKEALSLLSFSS